MRYLLTVFLLAPVFGLSQARITTWFSNKKAASVITFDDNCPGQFNFALPALNSRNIPATFYIITNATQCGMVDWSKVDQAYQSGHEIGSHSVTHRMLRNLDTASIHLELRQSWQTISTRYPNQKGMTIAWPFGQGGGSPVKDDTIRQLAAPYYFAARSAGIGPRGFTPYDDYNNPFYTNRSFYHMLGTYLMSATVQPATIGSILDSTIKYGGLFTCLYHGIEDVGFGLVPLGQFEQTLDTMLRRQSSLWITTFAQAAKYHALRRATSAELVANGTNYRLTLSTSIADTVLHTPLTIRLTVGQLNGTFDQIANIRVLQNGQAVDFSVDGDSVIQFNAKAGTTLDLIGGTTSLRPVSSKLKLQVYPNPVNHSLVSLSISGGKVTEQSTLTLHTTAGQLVWQSNIEPEQWQSKKVDIRLPAVGQGLYLLQWQMEGQTHRQHIAINP